MAKGVLAKNEGPRWVVALLALGVAVAAIALLVFLLTPHKPPAGDGQLERGVAPRFQVAIWRRPASPGEAVSRMSPERV